MPIDTTLGTLAGAESALTRLSEDKLPYQTAYSVAKVLRAVSEELRHFHEERNKLVREYGEPGEPPEEVKILPTSPNWAAFRNEFEELAAVKVTLPVDPLDLTTISNLTIAPLDLLQLGPLIKE